MFLTIPLFKKAKSKHVMVVIESLVSGHKATAVRERQAEKVEVIRFDPYLKLESVYREIKKIRGFESTK